MFMVMWPSTGLFGLLGVTSLKKYKVLSLKNKLAEPGVVAHAFNPSTWEAEAGRFHFISFITPQIRIQARQCTQEAETDRSL